MAPADGLRRSVKGLNETEFRERFGTEEACRKALFEMRWREGLAWPARPVAGGASASFRPAGCSSATGARGRCG